jgi:chemotaxis signal transduction protein
MKAQVRDGLECVVNGRSVAVAVSAVDRLIEYQVSPPLPLSQPWVGGLGVEGGLVFVSLRLAQGAGNESSRKGVLFVSQHGSMRWTLEVDGVKGVVEVQETDGEAARVGDGWTCPPRWLVPARSGERALAWLDLADVEATLRAQQGAR